MVPYATRQRRERKDQHLGAGTGRLALRRGLVHHCWRRVGQLHRVLGPSDFVVAPFGQWDGWWRFCPGVWPGRGAYAGGASPWPVGWWLTASPCWDGSAWHAMGSGMGGSSPDTYAVAVGPDGSLYAAGEFTSVGGVAANHVARWDGASWSALGDGVNGSVFALAFGPDGSLYAGGSFTTAGGVVADYLALWDATTSSWHPVGGGTKRPGPGAGLGPDDLRLRWGLLHHRWRAEGQPYRPLGPSDFVVAPPGQWSE